jgi:hypothetical protein
MNTIIPIFISPEEPEKCPECQKEEDIKEVCRHCGYEYLDYSDIEFSWKGFLKWLLLNNFDGWLGWTKDLNKLKIY